MVLKYLINYSKMPTRFMHKLAKTNKIAKSLSKSHNHHCSSSSRNKITPTWIIISIRILPLVPSLVVSSSLPMKHFVSFALHLVKDS